MSRVSLERGGLSAGNYGRIDLACFVQASFSVQGLAAAALEPGGLGPTLLGGQRSRSFVRPRRSMPWGLKKAWRWRRARVGFPRQPRALPYPSTPNPHCNPFSPLSEQPHPTGPDSLARKKAEVMRARERRPIKPKGRCWSQEKLWCTNNKNSALALTYPCLWPCFACSIKNLLTASQNRKRHLSTRFSTPGP